MALFGEKYGDRVRVIEIHAGAQPLSDAKADAGAVFSLELCGGTHCTATGDLGAFRILAESSVSAGVRRIEAVAGEPALAEIRRDQAGMDALGRLLRRDGPSYAEQVTALLEEQRALRRELARHQQDAARAGLEAALARPRQVVGLNVVSARVEAEDKNALMQLGDHVRDKLGDAGVVALGADLGGKATVIVTVTPDLFESGRLHAGELVKALAAAVGGRGGGRPNTAQAGLPDLGALDAALAAIDGIVAEQAAD